MIQRIQTLFLSVAIIACALLFFFPIATYQNEIQGTYKLFATGMKYMDQQTSINFWATFPMLFLLSASILLSLAAIFTFKKRKLQLLFVNINILFTIAFVAFIFLFYSDHFFREIVKAQPSYQFGGFIPLISLVFLILAFRAIRKDEALIKSTDRLR
jgi:hypothetical protein